MNYVDVLLLLPLAYGLIRGLFKGLIHELASLAAIVFGVLAAYYFSDELAAWLSSQFDDGGAWIKILSYVLIFLAVAIVLHILAGMLTKLLKMMALGFVNRILGGLFGLAKVLLIMLILIFLLDPYLKDWRQSSEAWKKSTVYKELQNYSDLPGQLLTDFKDQNELEDWPTTEP